MLVGKSIWQKRSLISVSAMCRAIVLNLFVTTLLLNKIAYSQAIGGEGMRQSEFSPAGLSRKLLIYRETGPEVGSTSNKRYNTGVFEFTNTSASPIQLKRCFIGGKNPEEFRLVVPQQCETRLEPKALAPIFIELKSVRDPPRNPTGRSATLVIIGLDGLGREVEFGSADLGEIYYDSNIAVSANKIFFDCGGTTCSPVYYPEIFQNNFPTRRITFQNTGKSYLRIAPRRLDVPRSAGLMAQLNAGVLVQGPDATSFEANWSSQDNWQLAPGKSVSLEITFKPRSAGVKKALIALDHNVHGLPPIDITLEGIGQPQPVIKTSIDALNTQSLDFGKTQINTVSTKVFGIINNGGADLIIKNISIDGAQPEIFRIQSSTCQAVKEKSDCEVTLEFKPRSSGLFSANLNIIHNALTKNGGYGQSQIRLVATGQGLAPTCPSGFSFSKTGDKCEGRRVDPAIGTCGPGFVKQSGSCVAGQSATPVKNAAFSCPIGTTPQSINSAGVRSAQCVGPPICAVGRYENGVCVDRSPQVSCPSGARSVNGECVTQRVCPSNSLSSGQSCVSYAPPVDCPSGTVGIVGGCVAPPKCSSGVLEKAGQGFSCVENTPAVCPGGTTSVDGNCVGSLSCAVGDRIFGNTGSCLGAASAACPAVPGWSGPDSLNQCTFTTREGQKQQQPASLSCPPGMKLAGGNCMTTALCLAGPAASFELRSRDVYAKTYPNSAFRGEELSRGQIVKTDSGLQCSFPISCPRDFSFDKTSFSCKKSISACSIFGSIGDQCVVNPGKCPIGFNQQAPARGSSEPLRCYKIEEKAPCPLGTTSDNQCKVTPLSCPVGFNVNIAACERQISPNCPTGASLQSGQCIAALSCPAGFEVVNGACTNIDRQKLICPAGSELAGNLCVSPLICPVPTTLTKEGCAAAQSVSPICPQGFNFRGVLEGCVP